jgi:hypothetical protein
MDSILLGQDFVQVTICSVNIASIRPQMSNIDSYMSIISDRFEDSPAFDMADAVWLVFLDKSAF